MILTLFFSRGVSLKLWVDKGLFDREKLPYEAHLKEGTVSKVYWITYGVEDRDLSLSLKEEGRLHDGIEVFTMPNIFNIPKIGSYMYTLAMPFIYRGILKKSDIYKTNQTDGSWSAVIAKKMYGKKLLYRTGFTMSQLENKLKRFHLVIRKAIEFFEKIAYKHCDKAIVASQHNLEYITKKYAIDTNKVEVIHNFIDRDRFYDFKEEREEKVTFVGRLSDEKNIFNLITALNSVDLPLEIYGSGPLQEVLETFIQIHKYDVRFMGNVSNNMLPKILNKSKYYALVSKHEGMPKALIEGMACGCICIGTNVSGINEVITDDTGIYADDISSDAIEKAFMKALNLSSEKINTLKNNMKLFIDNAFTLEHMLKREKVILKGLFDG